ncbi:glutaredoxin family protein [Candidatus Margulisiibacteriota bacterium]
MANVTIFSTPTCPYCKQAKAYFKEKGIEFTDKNVADDKAAAEDMVRRSGQMAVPVIDIDGKLIVGFNKPEIDQLLNL